MGCVHKTQIHPDQQERTNEGSKESKKGILNTTTNRGNWEKKNNFLLYDFADVHNMNVYIRGNRFQTKSIHYVTK